MSASSLKQVLFEDVGGLVTVGAFVLAPCSRGDVGIGDSHKWLLINGETLPCLVDASVSSEMGADSPKCLFSTGGILSVV